MNFFQKANHLKVPILLLHEQNELLKVHNLIGQYLGYILKEYFIILLKFCFQNNIIFISELNIIYIKDFGISPLPYLRTSHLFR